MKKTSFQLQFHTPAFMGDAAQSGRWRTPPFKAQLRQWWRVAYAAKQGFAVNLREMREIEGCLFGHAWLENDCFERDGKRVVTAARKSEVRLRLSHWSEGQLKTWERLESGTVFHPEAEKVRNQVGPHAYMGYGPLDGRGGTKLQDKQGKPNAAIKAGESAQLSVAYPDNEAPLIEKALQLMSHFGATGGRSRNGWGSYSLLDTRPSSVSTGLLPSQSLNHCLRHDWPHAVGADSSGPLIWQTAPHKDWAFLMKNLAQAKIGLRTHFVFKSGNNAPAPEDRHWLSYPVTNHSVSLWGNNARLPNTLRFKVRPMTDGQVVGVIFHMPHLPPAEFRPQVQTLERIWREVHAHLDQNKTLQRITA